jgi:hypothetical protein
MQSRASFAALLFWVPKVGCWVWLLASRGHGQPRGKPAIAIELFPDGRSARPLPEYGCAWGACQ